MRFTVLIICQLFMLSLITYTLVFEVRTLPFPSFKIYNNMVCTCRDIKINSFFIYFFVSKLEKQTFTKSDLMEKLRAIKTIEFVIQSYCTCEGVARSRSQRVRSKANCGWTQTKRSYSIVQNILNSRKTPGTPVICEILEIFVKEYQSFRHNLSRVYNYYLIPVHTL